MLEVHLHKRIGGGQLDVAWRAEAGSLHCLYGASGAGKTTILRMLAGLTVPDGGRIVVGGETWYDSECRRHWPVQRRSLGFVFQHYALFPNLTVRQNVAYALARHEQAWLDQLLRLCHLQDLQARLPAELSGGQQQRVALARALARKPKLLLLDEPLSALDAAIRRELQTLLLDLQTQLGLTCIMVSHDLAEVFRLAGTVHVLQDGRIARSGSPAQVFLQQQLAGKLNLQAQVLAVRREEVVVILTLLVAAEIVEIIASEEEAAGLQVGEQISISAKAFSPLIFRQDGSRGGAVKTRPD